MYLDSDTALQVTEIADRSEGDFFNFISETRVEVSEDDNVFEADYVFEDTYFFLINEEGERFLYGQGDFEKIENKFGAATSVTMNSMRGISSSFEDDEDIGRFPFTFENLIDWHEYDAIDEIQGDDYLLIHNVSIAYE